MAVSFKASQVFYIKLSTASSNKELFNLEIKSE